MFLNLYLVERTWRRVMTMRGISVQRKRAMTTMSISVVVLASLLLNREWRLKLFPYLIPLVPIPAACMLTHLFLFLPACKSVPIVPMITISEVLAMLGLLVLDPKDISLFFRASALFIPANRRRFNKTKTEQGIKWMKITLNLFICKWRFV